MPPIIYTKHTHSLRKSYIDNKDNRKRKELLSNDSMKPEKTTLHTKINIKE